MTREAVINAGTTKQALSTGSLRCASTVLGAALFQGDETMKAFYCRECGKLLNPRDGIYRSKNSVEIPCECGSRPIIPVDRKTQWLRRVAVACGVVFCFCVGLAWFAALLLWAGV